MVKPRAGRGSRDVRLLDRRAAVVEALRADPSLIAQTRLGGREFTADALVARDGELLTVVPRWRVETKAGISVKGTTFDSPAVTDVVAGALAAVGLTGPANVQGFVADDGRATVVEINPRFSGGLPLTLAAGADVVEHLPAPGSGSPGRQLQHLWFTPGVSMRRYFAEVFTAEDGSLLRRPQRAPGRAGMSRRRSVLVPFGTRPEVVKLAPVVAALRAAGHRVDVVDTGQHTDPALAGELQQALGLTPTHRFALPTDEPAARLGALHADAARAVARFRPDVVLALGDTNTVPAYALAARGAGVPFAHLEAGLRSLNPRSVEEVNRRVAAAVAAAAPRARPAAPPPSSPPRACPPSGSSSSATRSSTRSSRAASARCRVAERAGVLVTAHRPTNVDDPVRLKRLVAVVRALADQVGPVTFPVHPRTAARLAATGLDAELDHPADRAERADRLRRAARARWPSARLAVTDSGGIQEEAAYLGVPVVVLRGSTPRWEGVEAGTTTLAGLADDTAADAVLVAAAPAHDPRGAGAGRRPALPLRRRDDGAAGGRHPGRPGAPTPCWPSTSRTSPTAASRGDRRRRSASSSTSTTRSTRRPSTWPAPRPPSGPPRPRPGWTAPRVHAALVRELAAGSDAGGTIDRALLAAGVPAGGPARGCVPPLVAAFTRHQPDRLTAVPRRPGRRWRRSPRRRRWAASPTATPSSSRRSWPRPGCCRCCRVVLVTDTLGGRAARKPRAGRPAGARRRHGRARRPAAGDRRPARQGRRGRRGRGRAGDPHPPGRVRLRAGRAARRGGRRLVPGRRGPRPGAPRRRRRARPDLARPGDTGGAALQSGARIGRSPPGGAGRPLRSRGTTPWQAPARRPARASARGSRDSRRSG